MPPRSVSARTYYPSRRIRRRRLLALAAIPVVVAALVAPALDEAAREPAGLARAAYEATERVVAGDGPGPLGREEGSRALGPEDGYLAVGESVSPLVSDPVMARLAPSLRDAVRLAAADAGVTESRCW